MQFSNQTGLHTEFSDKTPATVLQIVSRNIASELRAFADAVEAAGQNPATFRAQVDAARVKHGLTQDANYHDRYTLHFWQTTEAVQAFHDAEQAKADDADHTE